MIRAAILTMSDKGFRGEREDKSGQVIKEMIISLPSDVVSYEVIPDEKEIIKKKLLISRILLRQI